MQASGACVRAPSPGLACAVQQASIVTVPVKGAKRERALCRSQYAHPQRGAPAWCVQRSLGSFKGPQGPLREARSVPWKVG